MKRLFEFLSILIFYFGSNVYGQNHKVDSLVNAIKNSKCDTTKASLYNSIGENLWGVNLDSSLFYFNQSIALIDNLTNKSNNELHHQKYSVLRAKTLRLIGITYTDMGNYNLAKEYLLKSLKLFEDLKDQNFIPVCYLNLGLVHCELGSYDIANELYFKARKIYQESNSKSGLAKCYSRIGNVYNYQGVYDKAIENYLKALSINEELNNKTGMSACYTNMGGVYYYQKNYEKAIALYTKSLKIDEFLGDKSGVSINYNNIGLAYTEIKGYRKAIDYFLNSINICEELGEKSGIADGYNNIGLVYKEVGEVDKALDCYVKSLAIVKVLNDKNGIIAADVNIADLHIALAKSLGKSNPSDKANHLQIAIKHGSEAIKMAQESKLTQLENYASKSLMNAYREFGNRSEAFRYAEILIATNDSMFKKDKTDALAEMEAKYQNEKKQKEIEILEIGKTVSQEKAQKQKILIISISIGFILLVFMVTFILRRLQLTRRQKAIIEEKGILLSEQNEEIRAQGEEIATQRDNLELMNIEIKLQHDQIYRQHQDITASINYASRIQQAMLPSQEIVTKHFPDFFVMYRPCQIVSGDFYWFKQFKNIMYIVAADCTGHGIPGAFMSMLGLSLLNDTIGPRDVNPPHESLNELRKRLKKTLHQTGLRGEQQDGMDIAMCMIDLETNIIQFSGAYNPMYLLRNNEIIVHKGDRMPIGVHPKDTESFTTKEIQLQPNDCVYIFSDGYVSQTGGGDFKKFKSSRLQETLLQNKDRSMIEQKQILENSFDVWKGQNDQLDDILVIGVKVV